MIALKWNLDRDLKVFKSAFKAILYYVIVEHIFLLILLTLLGRDLIFIKVPI